MDNIIDVEAQAKGRLDVSNTILAQKMMTARDPPENEDEHPINRQRQSCPIQGLAYVCVVPSELN